MTNAELKAMFRASITLSLSAASTTIATGKASPVSDDISI
jgi:hypothetical protein